MVPGSGAHEVYVMVLFVVVFICCVWVVLFCCFVFGCVCFGGLSRLIAVDFYALFCGSEM